MDDKGESVTIGVRGMPAALGACPRQPAHETAIGGEGGHGGCGVRAHPGERKQLLFGVGHVTVVAFDHCHGRSVQAQGPTGIAQPPPRMDRIAGRRRGQCGR